jgi:hypothetical protein
VAIPDAFYAYYTYQIQIHDMHKYCIKWDWIIQRQRNKMMNKLVFYFAQGSVAPYKELKTHGK